MHQEGKWLCGLSTIHHFTLLSGWDIKSRIYAQKKVTAFALLRFLDVLDPFPLPFAPRAVPILCSILLLKSQGSMCDGKMVFPEEGRPTSAWQYLEPIMLPVAWSPFFVLWIRSRFLGFF